MEATHYRALVSANSKEQADAILDHLLTNKIISGGLITHGPSRYWWKGKIEEREYYNISTFIPASKKESLMAEVKIVSKDETPIVALFCYRGESGVSGLD